MNLPPRVTKCFSIKRHISAHPAVLGVGMAPSQFPVSLLWTIGLKLAIHYIRRSTDWSEALPRKTAILHVNFRTKASATLTHMYI